MYIAFSPKGTSKLLFFQNGLAVNQYVYRDECLTKSLVPFLRKHHSDGRFVFWPDLASPRYAKTVLEFLQAENVPFVPKSINPSQRAKSSPNRRFLGYFEAESVWEWLVGSKHHRANHPDKMGAAKSKQKDFPTNLYSCA